MTNELDELKTVGEAPDWMQIEGLKTLKNGYFLPDETPKAMYRRVASAAASYYEDSDRWEEKFFNAMWNNWLCISSPIASNLGSGRGLPISCNSIHIEDSISSIFMKNHELAMLSKKGAGVGVYLGDIRARGEVIKGNGKSEGTIPWCKTLDTTVVSVSQGSTRRGAAAVYLPIDHGDIEEFINIRRPTGDVNRRCLNLNHGICITDDWMKSMIGGDKKKRLLWQEILKNRVETGEPYLFFSDNVNSQNPDCYTDNNLTVKTSNICCLAGETLVLTKIGPERIDSLIDKEVEIWDGFGWVKTNSFSQRGVDNLIRIHLADGSHIDSNESHRWFISKGYSQIRNNKLTMSHTKDLVIGDYIEYHTESSEGEVQALGAYIKGFLLGDGTQDKNKELPLLNLHSTKFECESDLISSLMEITISNNKTNTITDVGFSDIINTTGKYASTFGNQIFKRMHGLTARRAGIIKWTNEYKKNLPQEVYFWNRDSRLKLLSGIIDADGTINKHSPTISIPSIHQSFIEDLYILVKSLGIACVIDKTFVRKETKEILYRLNLPSSDSFSLLNELNCNRVKLNQNHKKPNRKLTTFRKIVKIEKIDGVHPVYCPSLPTTGKFGLANGLMTGNTEIFLHTDPDHSFVCCLSSLNLTKWEEWKDTDTVQVTVRFLDAVLQEYIVKSEGVPGLEASRRSAIKGRAIGIGVLGWHTLLQSRMIPFDSFEAMALNAEIFKHMRSAAEEETKVLSVELGEPEWCKGHGRRNTHLLAVAPTVSNSIISGGHSAGIEPIAANIYSQKSAKGTFIRKNTILEKLLQQKEQDTLETWKSINERAGSVQHLKYLSDNEKEVFLTAREINQHAIVKQAAQRQRWIDQGQSINLFFASNSNPKYIHEVHLAAWEAGLKSLYYLRAEGVIRGDLASRSKEECSACEG